MKQARLGPAVRAARARRGWTRETLAHNSGLSFAAITQIETGRRTDVRVSSLLALAEALQVNLNYLVRGDVAPLMLEHRALAFDSTDTLVDLVSPLVRDALEAQHAVLVVTTGMKAASIRDATGAVGVEFADAADWYESPADATTRYATFVRDACAADAPWVDVLGEPVWDRRNRTEAQAWLRYEALLNVIFAPWPATVTCLYDMRTARR